MNEFKKIIEEYSKVQYIGFSGEYPLQKDRMKIAQKYLSKYWIAQNEYQKDIVPILNRIFINLQCGIEKEFLLLPDFSIVPHSGYCLIDEEIFQIVSLLQRNLKEKQLFIIQNVNHISENSMFVRLGYPSDISWEEISNGGFISNVLFNMPYNEYMIFGDSAKWGCYSALEADPSLNIWGVREEAVDLIPSIMPTDTEEINYVKNNLPNHLRNFDKVFY